jgi:sugar phosphate isomerase/epimerase
MSEPKPEALPTVGKLCDEYGISVGLHNHDQKASPQYWNPENIVKLVEGRSPRLGACGDVGYWIRAGIDPVHAIRTLGPRLITLQLHDLDVTTVDGHDVPWGTGKGQTEAILAELKRLRLQPTMIGLEYSYDWLESMPKVAQSIEFFNQATMKLAE